VTAVKVQAVVTAVVQAVVQVAATVPTVTVIKKVQKK
jgi:hypothetical protein